MSIETKDEIENFNNDVKNILESNFKELISEIISSFGNDFFDKIIKYNENFKITGFIII